MATTQNALQDLLDLSDTQRQKREREQRLRDAQGAPQAPEVAQAAPQAPPVDPQAQAEEEAQQFLAANVKVPVAQHTPETALKFHESLLELGDRRTAKKYQQERASGQLAEPREVVGDVRSITAFEAASLGWTNELIRDEKVRKWVDGDLSGISAKEYLHMEQAYDQRTGFLRQDYVVNRENIAQRVVENFGNSSLAKNALPGGPEDRDNILAHLQSFVDAQLTEIDAARSELRSPREVDWSAVKRQIDTAGLPIAIPDFQAMAQQLLSEAIMVGTSPDRSGAAFVESAVEGQGVPDSVKAILQDVVSAQIRGANLPSGPTPVDWNAVEKRLEGTGVSLFDFHDLVEGAMGRIMIGGAPITAAGGGPVSVTTTTDSGREVTVTGPHSSEFRKSGGKIEEMKDNISETALKGWTIKVGGEVVKTVPLFVPGRRRGGTGEVEDRPGHLVLDWLGVRAGVFWKDYPVLKKVITAFGLEQNANRLAFDQPTYSDDRSIERPPSPTSGVETADVLGFDSADDALEFLRKNRGNLSQEDFNTYLKILGKEPEK